MRRWDAVVIGAGPSGSVVAHTLAQRGRSVCLVDGGPMITQPSEPPLVDEDRWGFCASGPECSWLRVRAVGGGSLAWGGWAHRFPAVVFRDHGWPFDAATLAPHYDAVEKLLGVVPGTLDERYVTAAADLGIPIEPKRGAVRGDRPWTALDLPSTHGARANVVALSIEHHHDSAICVRALEADGRSIELHARSIVLAASAVETTRLLLASDLQVPGLGQLDYHLILGYALIEQAPAPGVEGRGPFPGAALIPRFVNVNGEPKRDYPGGFSIELDGPRSPASLGDDLRIPIDAVLAGCTSESRVTFIHGIGESASCPERRIDLAPEETDVFGRSKPRIHLAWAESDSLLVEEMDAACLQVADTLATGDANLVQYMHPFEAPLLFHESGTCAMGDTQSAAAAPDGRLRALDNVWVADASALPSPGDRHPTLTIAAHALRAAESVERFLSHG